MKIRYLFFAVSGALSLTMATQLCAQVFKYRDPNGVVVYTDEPIDNPGYQLVWQKAMGVPTEGATTAPPEVYAKIGNQIRSDTPKTRFVSGSTKENYDRYGPMVTLAARNAQLSPDLLHAVVMTESSYNPNAESKAGAQGLMQLMPGTAKRYGVSDSFNPEENLSGGSRYLRDLLKMFDNRLPLALAAYNAGENAVKRNGNQIPPYEETRDYVKKVLNRYMENRVKTANTKYASR